MGRIDAIDCLRRRAVAKCRAITGTLHGRGRSRLRPVFLELENRRLLATFTVTNASDTLVDGNLNDPTSGTLRWAVEQADSAGGTNVIDFDPTAFDSPQTITLTDGELELSDTSGSMTINGPAAGVTVSGGGTSRVFEVDEGVTATITGLTISNGSTVNGAGIYSQGDLTLDACTLTGNQSTGYGGAVFTIDGTLDVSDCTIASNTSGESGGGLECQGTTVVTNCTFLDNYAGFDGGAIDNFHSRFSVSVGDTILSDDSAASLGPDFQNGVISLGYNLVGETDSSWGWVKTDLTGTIGQPLEPQLAPLGNYGGPTPTLPLLPGSPGIGEGTETDYAGTTTPITTDQRGEPLDYPEPDIGAFQTGGYVLDVTAGSTPQTTPVGTAFADALGVTITAVNPLDPVNGGVVTFAAPTTGASATLSSTSATIGTNGLASVTATANTSGGSYIVTASFDSQTVDFNLTNALPPGLSVADSSISYGTTTAIVSGALVYSGTLPVGETVWVTLDGTQQPATIDENGDYSATFDTSGFTVAQSPYSISCQYDGDNSLAPASTTGTLSVDPAVITITPQSVTKTYGTDDPPLTYTASGFAYSDTAASVLTGTITRAEAGTLAGEQAGTYAITRGTLATTDTNYTIEVAGATLTIQPATLTVVANPATKVYGTEDPTLTYTATGFIDTTVDGVTIDDTAGSILRGQLSRVHSRTLAGEQVGSYAIMQGTLFAGVDYAINLSSGTLSITPASLTVSADSLTKTYGTPDPALTVTTVGLVDSTVDSVSIDDQPSSVLSGQVARAQAGALAGEQVGSYAITQGTLTADADYTMTFSGSTLTITPATLTVATNDLTKVYGTADPPLTDTATGFVDATVDGVAIDDTASSVLTGTLARAQSGTLAGEQVGSYAISQGTLGADSDYTLDFTGSTLTITPAALTVAANDLTKVYGTPDPTLIVTVTGLIDATLDGVTIDDTAASVLTGALTRGKLGTAAGEQIGTYAITRGTLAADSDYTLHFTNALLTITPATLTVSANALTKVYGTPDPALTVTTSGLVDATVDGVTIDDTAASTLTGNLVRAQAGTLAGEQVGSYAITQGTLTAGDYTIQFAGGTLSISPATLTVITHPLTKVYGTADPTLTDAVTGFVDTTVDGVTIDDTAASVLSGALTRAAGQTVAGSPYAITQGTLAADSDYTLDFTGSTLTITPATLVITANPQTKVYGSADPTLTYTVSGLVLPDTAATVLTGDLARAPGESVAGSPYAITQGTLAADSNYSIRFTGNDLTITPAMPALAVTAPGATYTGSPIGATANVAGTGGTEAPTLEGIAPTLTYYAGPNTSGTDLGSTPPTDPGTYTVEASFPGSTDYTAVQSAPVTFVIQSTTATVALASSGSSAVYGQAISFVATVSLVAGTPSGTVTFLDGSTPLATVPLDGQGQAAVTLTSLPTGSQAITAIYSGNADAPSAKSGAALESVSPAATQIVLVPYAIIKKKKRLKDIALTAEIEPLAPGGGLPTGHVTYEFLKKHRKKTKVKLLGTASVIAGDATLTARPNKVLKKTLTIVYSGDPNFLASTTTITRLKMSSLVK